jgi:hypothetical protein
MASLSSMHDDPADQALVPIVDNASIRNRGSGAQKLRHRGRITRLQSVVAHIR